MGIVIPLLSAVFRSRSSNVRVMQYLRRSRSLIDIPIAEEGVSSPPNLEQSFTPHLSENIRAKQFATCNVRQPLRTITPPSSHRIVEQYASTSGTAVEND